ncbi:MAG: AAA family ATPase [Ignavibacteriales bacterium]
MRICGLYIDGFGVFRDQGIEDVPAGLALFTGNNESGKTTLMEFIRAVLFGLPRRPRNDYAPLRGGAHGGRLQLALAGGRLVTVERTGRRAVIVENGGGVVQAEPSERLLGGIDRQVFESVFAIGLKDIQGLDVLSPDSVSGRLFAAGAGLGAASVPEVIRTIDDELGGLLTQRESKKKINDLLRRLREVDREIAGLGSQSSEYARIEAERASLLDKIRTGREGEESIRRRLRRVEQLRRGVEPWANLSVLRRREAALAPVAEFPPNGLERLESLGAQIEQLRDQRKGLQDKVTRLEDESAGVRVDHTLLAHAEEIESLAGEREKLVSALREHPEASRAAERLKMEFERRLRELGPGWDAGRLDQVDASVQVRQSVQEMGRRLAEAGSRCDEAKSRSQAAGAAVMEAEQRFREALQVFEAHAGPPVRDQQLLHRRLEAARLTRSLAARRENLQVRLDAARDAAQDAQRRMERLRERTLAAPGATVRAPAAVFVLAVVFAAVFLAQRSLVPALAASVAAGIGTWLLFSLVSRGQGAAAGSLAAQMRADEEEAARAGEDARGGIEALEGQIAAIDGQIAEAAAAAGSGPFTGVENAERLVAGMERAIEDLRVWKDLERRRDEAGTAVEAAVRKAEAARRAADEAAAALRAVQDEWTEWLTARGFAGGIRPEGFEAVLQAVDSARSARRGLEEGEARERQLAAYIAGVKSRIVSVADACGRSPRTPGGGVDDLDEMARGLGRAREALRRASQLEGEIQEARSDISRIDGQLREKESAVAELLRQAVARDEEEFRRLAAQFIEWRETRQKMESCGMALLAIAGNAEMQAALEKELDGADPVALEAEEDALRERLNAVLEMVSQDTAESGRLGERLSQLAGSEDLGRLLLERNGIMEEIATGVRRWAMLAICRSLLVETRDAYERERQPEIIQKADRFLETMVGERYRVISPLGEGRIELEDVFLKRKGEGAWSRGLAEQVYLAVRLALANEFGRRAEPLPVVLDDVLVNFDPVRRVGAVRLILEFAAEQQVLMFSCHPEMKSLVAGLLREAPFSGVPFGHYSIEDGRLTRVQ